MTEQAYYMEIKNQAEDTGSNVKNLAARVSVVICVRNGEKIINDCLASTERNRPAEIIVVDGQSTDETVTIAQSHTRVRVVSDEGKGLAYARRVGADMAEGEYILYVGPDNLMEDGFIENFVSLKNEWGFDAASVQTRVHEPKTFWDRGLDFRWKCLMGTPGPLKVVGTPSLYEKCVLNEVKFSENNLGPNDDTDVADQLIASGYKLGLVPLQVYDQNGWNSETTWNRFKWYGTGDYYYYQKYKQSWTFSRKLKSLTHPWRQTFRYMGKAILALEISAAAWLLYVMVARYHGWLTLSLKSKNR